ncbi:MAG: cupin domain-containing protein [Rhodospirillales bacterium]|nr:cupin domain-containing protein [Rhodospirillales bacterium]
MAAPAGASHIGARLCVVPPGKSAWPYHCHHANDELFVILEGQGELRLGTAVYAFRRNDVLVCPAGGRETAHRIRNTGAETLRYLAVSSMREPDIMEYPDSRKWGAFAGAAPGGKAAERTFSAFVREDARVDYWDGEEE